MNRNPLYCPHNMTDTEDGEEYCIECGTVISRNENFDRYESDGLEESV